MINITDKNYLPTLAEISQYICNPLFDDFVTYLSSCDAKTNVAYSGDKVLLGWNVRFSKGGRTLCRAYPFVGYFKVLLVVGQREKEKVEALLPAMSTAMQQLYADTKEGMGQRWLLLKLTENNKLYDDLLKLIDVRRFS